MHRVILQSSVSAGDPLCVSETARAHKIRRRFKDLHPPHHAGASVDTHGPHRPGAMRTARLAIPIRYCALNQKRSSSGRVGSDTELLDQKLDQNFVACAERAATSAAWFAFTAGGSGGAEFVVSDVRTVETIVALVRGSTVKLIACRGAGAPIRVHRAWLSVTEIVMLLG